MWFDIFKVQQGSFSALIPKNLPKIREDTNCLDELKSHEQKIQAKKRELENKWKVDIESDFGYLFTTEYDLSDEIDEGLACKILEVINDIEFKVGTIDVPAGGGTQFSYNGRTWNVYARYNRWEFRYNPQLDFQTGIMLEISEDYSTGFGMDRFKNEPNYGPKTILKFKITLYADSEGIDYSIGSGREVDWAETWKKWRAGERWKWF